MPTAKQTRLNEISRGRGFKNYYEERELAKQLEFGNKLWKDSFNYFLKAWSKKDDKEIDRNKGSMKRFQRAVAKRSYNEEIGISEAKDMQKIPQQEFEDQFGDLDMGQLYDTDYWYDQDWEEYWDEYEF